MDGGAIAVRLQTSPATQLAAPSANPTHKHNGIVGPATDDRDVDYL